MNITKDKYFLDTNVFIYSFDKQQKKKHNLAIELIQNALKTQRGIISTQVIQEFLNVVFRKFEKTMTAQESEKYFKRVLIPLCEFFPSFQYYQQAIEIKKSYGYSFYDALILTAAIQTSCKILYSEDFQNGQSVEGVRVINPFSEP